MALLLNTALPFNSSIQRLVAASLAGKQAHVLRVATPPNCGTLSRIEQLYADQRCARLNISSGAPLVQQIRTAVETVARADKSGNALAVIIDCNTSDESRALIAGLSGLLADRPATALVEVVRSDGDPSVTHYLNCADAQTQV